MKILLATHNQHKKIEMLNMLQNLDIEVITLLDLNDLEDVIEDGDTFYSNALLKAKYFAIKHQMITVSDDSGLMVDYLDGKPGVHSKRFSVSTSDNDNIELMLHVLKDTNNRAAQFISVICLYDPFKNEERFYEGIVQGEITKEAVGSHGFGYDPIFYVKEQKKTMAEMPLEIKNQISHRAIALKKLKEDIYENIDYFRCTR